MQQTQKVPARLWDVERVVRDIRDGAVGRNLEPALRSELAALTELNEKVAVALTDPKPLEICLPVLNAVLAAQYFEVFDALKLPKNLCVYEPCVGASPPVIVATAAHSGGAGRYHAINLNQKLREQLREKTRHLTMPIEVIADNAQHAMSHFQALNFDAACFHHAINDILQTVCAEPRGMDTTQIDWFPNERQMIEWLAQDLAAGRLETRGRPELLRIIADAAKLVRPGGYLIFDHFNWQKYDNVPWFPCDLFYNFIPMTRRWISEAKLPVSEIQFNGVDPQWWMILQVKGA